MTRTSRSIGAALTLSFTLALSACGPKDADIKAAVDTAIAGEQGVTVSITNGVATIAGQFADAAAKTSVEAKVGAVKGVKSVVDNATVTPPPAPVVISPDDSLKTNVMAALKEFNTLTADVKDGVVTLTGEVKKTDLPTVMQALSAMHPKKIDNKATVKK